METDKNIGGCILLRDTYIRRGVIEHLGNTQVYKPLSQQQANNHQQIIARKTSLFVLKWSNKEDNCDLLSKAEQNFLLESIRKYPDNMAKFRMSLKAHKSPWKMRPIVCCAGTMLNNLSRWLDYWLQKTKPFIATYIKDSDQLLELLRNLGPLPPNARLFAAYANLVYTNIDTDHAMKVISEWLESIIN